jgi:hypothetical protein
MRPIPMRSGWLVVSTLALLTGAAGCSDPTPKPDLYDPGDTTDDAAAILADARYVTHLLFAGPDGKSFFGVFDQSSQERQLTRRYDAWWSDGRTWQPLVNEHDTLPVARAAWRILPTTEMAVRVGDAGQIVSLAFTPSDAIPVRLDAKETVSVWTSPTGQRESLGLGVLQLEDNAGPGLLFFRRAARSLSIPPTAGTSRTFVLADSLGNGLLFHTGDEQQPTVAHTWLHGTEAAWSGVILETLDSTEGAEEWSFRISGTDLHGNIRTRPGTTKSNISSVAPSRLPPLVIECVLFVGDEQFQFLGLSTRLILP